MTETDMDLYAMIDDQENDLDQQFRVAFPLLRGIGRKRLDAIEQFWTPPAQVFDVVAGGSLQEDRDEKD